MLKSSQEQHPHVFLLFNYWSCRVSRPWYNLFYIGCLVTVNKCEWPRNSIDLGWFSAYLDQMEFRQLWKTSLTWSRDNEERWQYRRQSLSFSVVWVDTVLHFVHTNREGFRLMFWCRFTNILRTSIGNFMGIIKGIINFSRSLKFQVNFIILFRNICEMIPCYGKVFMHLYF